MAQGETHTVYKVIRHSKSGRLYSAIMRAEGCREWELEYIPGQPTHPAIGRCFAFESQQAAQNWWAEVKSFTRRRNREIWKAAAEQVMPALARTWLSDARIREFWAAGGARLWNGRFEITQAAPPGTVFCDELTLVERCE